MLNAVAWLISARRSDHTSPFLCELYALAACSRESDSGCVVAGLRGRDGDPERPSCKYPASISLPSRHSTVVPCWQSTPCRRCRRSSPPPLGQRSFAGRSINSTHDTRRPRLSCGCRQSMERPSTNDQGLTVAASLLTFQQLKHSFFNLHFTDSIMTDFSELLKISLLDDTKNNSNSSTIH